MFVPFPSPCGPVGYTVTPSSLPPHGARGRPDGDAPRPVGVSAPSRRHAILPAIPPPRLLRPDPSRGAAGDRAVPVVAARTAPPAAASLPGPRHLISVSRRTISVFPHGSTELSRVLSEFNWLAVLLHLLFPPSPTKKEVITSRRSGTGRLAAEPAVRGREVLAPARHGRRRKRATGAARAPLRKEGPSQDTLGRQ